MIKQEDLFKKLGLILNELNDQYQFLAQNPQQLNELELELFHANANFLADHVQIIKKINTAEQNVNMVPIATKTVVEQQNSILLPEDTHEESQLEEITFANNETDDFVNEGENAIEVDEIEEQEFVFENEVEETIVKFEEIEEEVFKLDDSPSTFEFILNDHSEHEKFEFEEKSVDELFNRPLSNEEESILAQKRKLQEIEPMAELSETDEDEIGPEPFLVKKEEEFPIAKEDLTLATDPAATVEVNQTEPVEDPTYKATLNDLLAKSRSTTTNNNTSTSKISDLKQAINLNDKLLYIKDLFNGYNLAYAEAIDLANKLPNFEAADSFFQKNYAQKNNWAAKQATVDKFYELLNKRFQTPNA